MKDHDVDADGSMTIGSLAREAKVHLETIRFYQRKGLMPEPPRAPGGIRRYAGNDLARVRFIKSAQRLGFSLDEIGELLRLDDGADCNAARVMAEAKLAEVRARQADLLRMEAVLAQLVRRCSRARGDVNCPLIDALQEH
ncbi:MAG: Hg(II)-responsive transcriptional regulator [Rhodoferax sp.]|nr:Hg(II)-responsive transcriptional regulator [Rhodoferax sp.]